MTQHIRPFLICAILASGLSLLNGCATTRPQAALPDEDTAVIVATTAAAQENTGQPATADPGLPEVEDSPAEPATDPGAAAPELPPAPMADEASAEPLIWDRLTAGFALPDHDHPRVQPDLNWYVRHPGYIDRVFTRAGRYLHFILGEVEKRGMPTEIALLPVVESAFHPFAYSHGRAAGIWQFIPGTARLYGLQQDWWYDGRRDIMASTRAALDYLQALHRRFDGDWLLALAAYNSGSGTVGKAIRRNRKLGRPTDFWHLKLPRETRGYVPKLLAISRLVGNAPQLHVNLPEIPDTAYLEAVDTGGQIDLALAAELADLPLDELYWLNPGFNRWATAPKGPHRLLLPLDKAEDFRQRLAELPADRRIRWQRHRVRSGETLSHIAKRYATRVSLLREVNGLDGNTIRAGQHLMIPVAARSLKHYRLSRDQRLLATQRRARKGVRQTHVVRKGDTLWDIARAYKVSVRQLARWNGMAPRDTLRPGQKLVVWTRPRGQRATAASDTIRPIRYTVRPGDSLARISQKFRVRVGDLVRWNGLDRKKYLQPGQKLTLYVDVTRQSERI